MSSAYLVQQSSETRGARKNASFVKQKLESCNSTIHNSKTAPILQVVGGRQVALLHEAFCRKTVIICLSTY